MLACSPIDSISRELTRTDYFIARWRSTGKACAWFCNQQPAKWIRVTEVTHATIAAQLSTSSFVQCAAINRCDVDLSSTTNDGRWQLSPKIDIVTGSVARRRGPRRDGVFAILQLTAYRREFMAC